MPNWLRNFMVRRYGVDALSIALFVLYLLLAFFGSAFDIGILYLLSLVPLGFCAWRIFSRNTIKRREENEKFLRMIAPLIGRARTAQRQHSDPYYKYLRCPSCSQHIRVPKGRGKIEITCPKCQKKFIRKT